MAFIKHYLFNATYSTINISNRYPLNFKDVAISFFEINVKFSFNYVSVSLQRRMTNKALFG